MAIHLLGRDDPAPLAAAFDKAGWYKPQALFERYLDEQRSGRRLAFVAEADGGPAGYVTLLWRSAYAHFQELGIPEIVDLNVVPAFQRRGIGTRLLDRTEERASDAASQVGIAVGLHPGYNAAQRMYVLRGYVPDGRGVTYENRYLSEGDHVPLDDNLTLHLIKPLR